MYSGPAAKVPRSGTTRKASTYHSRPSKPVSYSTTKQGSSGQGSSGQGRFLVNPKKFNPAEKARLAEELREKKYRDKMCNMCSEVNLPIYHHHFSSTDIRRMSNSEGNKSYMCCVCKDLEPVNIPAAETRRVVLADSSLYGVWDKMPPSKVHYDIDTIVGGRVRDMTIALRRNYLHMPNRLEVIVVAGIKNIGSNDKAETIIEDMEALKKYEIINNGFKIV